MSEDPAAGLLRQEASLVAVMVVAFVTAMALVYLDLVTPLVGAGFLLLAGGIVSAVSAQAFKARLQAAEEGSETLDELTGMLSSTVKARNRVAVFGLIAGTVLLSLGLLLG